MAFRGGRPEMSAAAAALMSVMRRERALAVVRARHIADPCGLAEALRAGGLTTVEFTLTTDNALEAIAQTADGQSLVGAGTVLDAAGADRAVAAGASFLVTPMVAEDVAERAHAADVPLICGALSPTEVHRARELGAFAVKVFPASLGGPQYLRDLRGPFPDVPFVPSGGVRPEDAAGFLAAGALAVSVGGSVVPADLVEAAGHEAIVERTAQLMLAIHRSE
jgi:2-dehydro-3-deoxyphosphogluconate aldolase / (4S)-4-hydroxy-2-oxoglutarate aldolase